MEKARQFWRNPLFHYGENVNNVMSKAIAHAQGGSFLISYDEDLAAIQQRIKELEQESEVESQMNKLDVAYKELIEAAKQSQAISTLPQDRKNRKRRKANFDKMAKQAEIVSGLHKKLKRTESGSV